jgi:hypothetical protein
MTAAKGTLAYNPNAPGSLDETGTVFFNLKNAGPICQEVDVKLVFGSQTQTQCTPGTTCCTASGTWAAKATKCDTAVQKAEYKCSSLDPGGNVMMREAFKGCTGTSATCGTAVENWAWSDWAVKVDCTTDQLCSVPDPTKLGTCVAATNPLCTKTDKYEAGASAATAYDLGDFNDDAVAKILDPKVHFKSATDVDWLSWHIADNVNFTDPKVHVEWTGADKLTVCAFYECEQAADGLSCEPVSCPAGTVPATDTWVSASTPNGCCLTAAVGTLDWKPVAPFFESFGDDSGTTYLSLKNASAVCQEVDVKIAFGDKTATQCTPKSTCCTDTGVWAAAATKCGTTALKTEYQCSSTAKGGDVQKREAFGGCTGTGATCSTSTTYWAWSAWATAVDCKTDEVCSVTSVTTPGVCKKAEYEMCKATDKYEAGATTNTAVDVGAFKDSDAAKVLDPDIHFNSATDADYIKYHIADAGNLSQPKVHVEWTGADKVKVCAWYSCDKGAYGEDCAPVTCPVGTSSNTNYDVSYGTPNGCCLTGTSGKIAFNADAPGLDESGWVYVRFENAGPVCQWVNVKTAFGGSETACGDGKCEGGESTSCKVDCGSCVGKCGAPYDSKAACQCDAFCADVGDCCWDLGLVCPK